MLQIDRGAVIKQKINITLPYAQVFLSLYREYVMLWAIWYHLYNLKNVKNTDGEV